MASGRTADADRLWLDGHVGRGPAGGRPDSRFMLWSHELGRVVPEPSDLADADTANAIRAGNI